MVSRAQQFKKMANGKRFVVCEHIHIHNVCLGETCAEKYPTINPELDAYCGCNKCLINNDEQS